jgi:hypothetical protein
LTCSDPYVVKPFQLTRHEEDSAIVVCHKLAQYGLSVVAPTFRLGRRKSLLFDAQARDCASNHQLLNL